MPKKQTINPKDYQWELDNEQGAVSVDEMTAAQLKIALCQSIDLIEEITLNTQLHINKVNDRLRAGKWPTINT